MVGWYLYEGGYGAVLSMTYIVMPEFDDPIEEFDEWYYLSNEEHDRLGKVRAETPEPVMVKGDAEHNNELLRQHANLIRMKLRNL